MMAMTANSGDNPIGMDYPSRGGRQTASSDQVEMDPSKGEAPSTFPPNTSSSVEYEVSSNRRSGTASEDDFNENKIIYDRRLSGDGFNGTTCYGMEGSRRHSAPLPSGLSALIMAATSQLSHLAEVACSRESAVESSSNTTMDRAQEYNKNRQYSLDEPTIDKGEGSLSHGVPGSSTYYNSGFEGNHQSHEHYPQQQQNLDQNNTHDSSSSNPNEKLETTPTIVPEPEPPRKRTFPEVLMSLAIQPENVDTITFLPDGKFFAIRIDKFTDEVLSNTEFNPPIRSYDIFLDVMKDWGFTGLLDRTCSEIAVYRHPNFIKGDWEQCASIQYEGASHSVRFQSDSDSVTDHYNETAPLSEDYIARHTQQIPSRIVDHSIHNNNYTNNNNMLSSASENNKNNLNTITKRRLSPGFLARRESISSVSSQKQRVEFVDETAIDPILMTTVVAPGTMRQRQGSGDESDANGGGASDDTMGSPGGSYCQIQSHGDDVRSIALAITAEKLNLHQNSSRRNSFRDKKDDHPGDFYEDDSKTPLVDQAVTSATHTIVTNAIATLLRDETHTKETYLKHEKELSKSCLPGVIPISTQLFSPDSLSNRRMAPSLPSVPGQMVSTNGTNDKTRREVPSDLPIRRSSLTSLNLSRRPSLTFRTDIHQEFEPAQPPGIRSLETVLYPPVTQLVSTKSVPLLDAPLSTIRQTQTSNTRVVESSSSSRNATDDIQRSTTGSETSSNQQPPSGSSATEK